jgi:hypothetical protein
LVGVVEHGTAQRVRGSFTSLGGHVIAVGGKTSTGNNRHEVYNRQGAVIKSQAINRTATFVFFIGDRFFGTITVFVSGAEAQYCRFTSSLPVQILKLLAPKFIPIIEGPAATSLNDCSKT